MYLISHHYLYRTDCLSVPRIRRSACTPCGLYGRKHDPGQDSAVRFAGVLLRLVRHQAQQSSDPRLLMDYTYGVSALWFFRNLIITLSTPMVCFFASTAALHSPGVGSHDLGYTLVLRCPTFSALTLSMSLLKT